MTRYLIIAFFLVNSVHIVFSQKLIISGTVRDIANGELLVGATVWDSLSQTGVQTNAYGFFSLEVPGDNHFLKVSFVGYASVYIKDFVQYKYPLDIKLTQDNLLKEVTIKEIKNIDAPAGSLSIPMDKIKAMPALLGEVDVLKALSFTPGVSTGTEGSAGLYIRGGTPDQNLILLDEVPVYNVTHLGGFFSVFNPNSLKSVDLYKGAFPARYGGRLASVIDLTMKDGNNQKFGGEVGIGILNQSLTLEGPIVKNKASFIVSGRVSTLGLSSLLQPKKTSGYGESRKYRFYDLNAKFNYQVNKTDQIYLSFYNGFDRFTYGEWSAINGRSTETSLGNNWGNTTATFRYSKVFSQKLFARFILLYSKYTSELANNFEDLNVDAEPVKLYRNTNAGLTDLGAKIQFDYFLSNRANLKFGLDLTRHSFSPFVTKSNYSGSQQETGKGTLPATQLDFHVDANISLTDRLHFNPGLRYSTYHVNNRTFLNPEPRLGLNWSLPANWALKGGYAIMNQYVHLLTNNGFGFGYDAWLPSTGKVVPSRSAQLSVGVYKTFPQGGLELSLEAYIKKMKNLIDYPDGTNFSGLLADSWDDIVIRNGVGRVKGIEMMLSKKAGKFNGWVSYTLSKSERKFSEINDAEWYPMKYDRRHNVAITTNYELGKKWKLSASFIYQTGHAVTLPEAAFIAENSDGPRFIYDKRNNGRMPAFHRLDIGASKSLVTPHKRNAELRLGLYNAYNRNNPLYLDMKTERNRDFVPTRISIKQVSFFPILPYIGYTLKF
ncbi:TonB-dependent receptor plug domain-containing protein [Cytophagaceae bacterium SJW1-29]|uniref:TonB-dependent receptor plug domain-containing protein n=1 Tax=Salmonirosea aquatica TaxID=2654236 RepID=A0A7C9FSK1_9BACT|nr:TonB-dependent receptor plug domain-containing protein [Cytophagaceae bacterium SJW1-29]